jgi:small subunit ribosomal protein S2
MKPYIFTKRKNIHILDLQQTIKYFNNTLRIITDIAAKGGIVLFLGTKKQSQEIIKEQAEKCKMPYVNQRWLGGLLTNFSTVKQSIERLYKLDEMVESGLMDKLPNKEKSRLLKEREKKQKILGGIKEMKKLPDAVFVIDVKKDEIGVMEARKLNIPVIGVLDTNADPDLVDYGIPGNDDAIRAIQLFCTSMADAIIDGRSHYEKELEKLEEEKNSKNEEAAAEIENEAAVEADESDDSDYEEDDEQIVGKK